jgi:hypothetical protein
MSGNDIEYVVDSLSVINPKALLLTGHNDAIEGYLVRGSKKPIAVYSISKICRNLCDMGMDEFDAKEYFDYNIRGSMMGEDGPVFLSDD